MEYFTKTTKRQLIESKYFTRQIPRGGTPLAMNNQPLQQLLRRLPLPDSRIEQHRLASGQNGARERSLDGRTLIGLHRKHQASNRLRQRSARLGRDGVLADLAGDLDDVACFNLGDAALVLRVHDDAARLRTAKRVHHIESDAMVSARGAERVHSTGVGGVELRIAFALQLHVGAGASIQVIDIGRDRRSRVALLQEPREAADERPAELFHLGSARTSLPALILKRPPSRVVEEEILGRNQPERPDEVMFEERHRVELAEKRIVRKQTVGHVFTAKANAAEPPKMV